MAELVVGEQIERWTVQAILERPSRAVLRCECGALDVMPLHFAVSRRQCSACTRVGRNAAQAPRRALTVGERLERWTVEQLVPADYPRRVKARCECGHVELFLLLYFYEGRANCHRCVATGRMAKRDNGTARAFRRCEPGERRGNWTVVADERKYATDRAVLCRCDCGAERNHDAWTLSRKKTQRCVKCCQAGRHARKELAIADAVRKHERAVASAKRAAQQAEAAARKKERAERAAIMKAEWLAEVRGHALAAAIKAARVPATETVVAAAPAIERLAKREVTGGHFIAGVGTDVRGDGSYFSCEVCETYDKAVEHLASTCELTKLQQVQLRRGAFVRLSGPADGAAYVEITRCECATPHVHSDSVTAGAAE